jgi:ADP-ribose pyrophosphatase
VNVNDPFIGDVAILNEIQMSDRRLYPEKPLVGVGVLIGNDDKYLLIKRAADPDKGLWSIPGGMVEIGEKAIDAARREAKEETNLDVEVIEVLDVVDKIVMDEESRVKFHFVIIDYLAELRGGTLNASSDALDARWVSAEEFPLYELPPTLIPLLKSIDLYPDT